MLIHYTCTIVLSCFKRVPRNSTCNKALHYNINDAINMNRSSNLELKKIHEMRTKLDFLSVHFIRI